MKGESNRETGLLAPKNLSHIAQTELCAATIYCTANISCAVTCSCPALLTNVFRVIAD